MCPGWLLITPMLIATAFWRNIIGILTIRNPVTVIVPKPLVGVGAEKEVDDILYDSSQHDLPPFARIVRRYDVRQS